MLKIFYRKIQEKLITFMLVVYAYLCIWTRKVSSHIEGNLQQIFDENDNLKSSLVILLWHEDCTLLPLCFWDNPFKRLKKSVFILSSKSRDSDYIVSLYTRFGFKTIRGSTVKKGKKDYKGAISSFRKMIYHLKDKSAIMVSPDGPRGPTKNVALGLVKIIKRTDADVLFLATAGKKEWRIEKSWDRHKPLRIFANMHIEGELVKTLPNDEDEANKYIKDKLNEVQQKARLFVQSATKGHK